MIVLDASAAFPALLNAGPARLAPAEEQVHLSLLTDAEVASGLRSTILAGVLAAAADG